MIKAYYVVCGVQYSFTLATPTSVWVIVGVIAAVLAIVLVLIVLPIVRFTITVDSSYIRAATPLMFRVTIKKEDVDHIAVMDLSQAPELRPTLRTFGVGLPGYKLGWFKLANGAKAFLAVTSSNKAVVIELKDGTYVIMTPKNLSEFLTALKELGWLS